jgi:Fe2+ or Zn2+ uptake regulation protein
MEVDFDQHLRDSGMRRTAQRYGILEYLSQTAVHATADEILSALNERFPLVSRATVYNTLRDLTRAGLVRELPWEGKAARYDANLHRHHHFVCDECGLVEDVPWFDVPTVATTTVAGEREIRAYEVTLRGLCRECRSNPTPAGTGGAMSERSIPSPTSSAS